MEGPKTNNCEVTLPLLKIYLANTEQRNNNQDRPERMWSPFRHSLLSDHRLQKLQASLKQFVLLSLTFHKHFKSFIKSTDFTVGHEYEDNVERDLLYTFP